MVAKSSPYLDSDGKPRVLAIAGPGATFESLARRFLPNMPLEEVVALACENSEVVTRPGDKIALLGSILVKLGESREKYLAHAIRQIDQLLQTLLHNRRVQPEGGWKWAHGENGDRRSSRALTLSPLWASCGRRFMIYCCGWIPPLSTISRKRLGALRDE